MIISEEENGKSGKITKVHTASNRDQFQFHKSNLIRLCYLNAQKPRTTPKHSHHVVGAVTLTRDSAASSLIRSTPPPEKILAKVRDEI